VLAALASVMASASSPTKRRRSFLSHAQPAFTSRAAINTLETLNQDEGARWKRVRKNRDYSVCSRQSTTALLKRFLACERCLQVRPAGKHSPQAVLKPKLGRYDAVEAGFVLVAF